MIEEARRRIERCQRLAAAAADVRMFSALSEIIAEEEAAIARLEADDEHSSRGC